MLADYVIVVDRSRRLDRVLIVRTSDNVVVKEFCPFDFGKAHQYLAKLNGV